MKEAVDDVHAALIAQKILNVAFDWIRSSFIIPLSGMLG